MKTFLFFCRELQCQLFSWDSQKRVWYVSELSSKHYGKVVWAGDHSGILHFTVSCSTFAAFELGNQCSSMTSEKIVTADSRVFSWYIFKQVYIVYLQLPLWGSLYSIGKGEENIDVGCCLTFPALSPCTPSWDLQPKKHRFLGFGAIAGYDFPVAVSRLQPVYMENWAGYQVVY